MTDVRIASIGAYTPKLRIPAEEFEDAWGQFSGAGISEKAVPEADEDALTMAYEASRRALDASGYTGSDIASLSLATTTPPMAEEDLTARLRSMLSTPSDVTTRTLTGSTRAGGQALADALDIGPWEDGVGVVVVSDCPVGTPESDVEQAAGAGAVSLVLDSDGPGLITDSATAVEPYPGTRFREHGEAKTTRLGVTAYERNVFKTLLQTAASDLDITQSSIDAAAVQSPDGKRPYRVASALGVETSQVATADTVNALGDTGAASAFFGLVSALQADAERVLLATYGSGAGATVFVIEGGEIPVNAALDGEIQLTYPAYLRRRGEITSGAPAGGGAYVSIPSWQRTIPQRHRLRAGRCSACESLNFPAEGACNDCGNRSGGFEPVTLPGTGVVEAVTTIAQGGAPPEFVEQQSRSGPFVSAIVAFDGPDGERSVSVPVQVLSSDSDAVEIGTPVEATIRRQYEQEGVIRYGIKVERVP